MIAGAGDIALASRAVLQRVSAGQIIIEKNRDFFNDDNFKFYTILKHEEDFYKTRTTVRGVLEAAARICKNQADFPWSPLPLPALSEEDKLLIEKLRIEHLTKIKYATELAIKLQTKIGKDIGSGTEIIARGFEVSVISNAKRKGTTNGATAEENDANKGKGQKKTAVFS